MNIPKVQLDQRGLKDKAHLLMSNGQFASAVGVYEALIGANGKDPSLRLHHAELCKKLNQPARAVESYRAAAGLFVSAGHAARARAALICALRIAPKDAGLKKLWEVLAADVPASAPKLALVKPARLPPPVKTPPPDDDPFEAVIDLLPENDAPPSRNHLRLAHARREVPFDEAVTDPCIQIPQWNKSPNEQKTVCHRRICRSDCQR